jgi:hypothetical protein
MFRRLDFGPELGASADVMDVTGLIEYRQAE